ncbi:putative reverse transcriptase domain-containing protein [Tanacetum coccineum]
MPPRRSSTTAKDAAAAARASVAAATPMTAAAVKQLIKARVSAALANHETLRNSTNVHGEGSHNSDTGIRGTVRTPLCYMHFPWKCSNMVELPHEDCFSRVAYAIAWKILKKMMTVKYWPRGEIKKLEIELWNLKVKGTDITSYTMRFQELALMCGRMFPEESDKVEKYVGGLPDMIQRSVIS